MRYEARPLEYAHLKEGVAYGIFRATDEGKGATPVFVVAPSAALLRRGIRGQLGLYAGEDFATNTHLGQYEGKVLGSYASPAEAARSEEAQREEDKGNGMMMVRKTRAGGYELVDGTCSPPPYFSLCNDPRGTRLEANVRPTEFGGLYTTRRVPAFSSESSLHSNAASELLWDYGSSYWRRPAKASGAKGEGTCASETSRGSGASGSATRGSAARGEGGHDREKGGATEPPKEAAKEEGGEGPEAGEGSASLARAPAPPSREAARRRKDLHRAIAQRDVQRMRRSIHELYVDEESPLRRLGEVKRVETYAPLVEATILARAYARGTALDKEMRLNFRHTHASFGLSRDDHDRIVAQIEEMEDGGAGGASDDPIGGRQDAEWCDGTPLHGRVKPRRHVRLFTSEGIVKAEDNDDAGGAASDWEEDGK